MYTLINSLPRRQLITLHMPTLVLSLVIAELLYKFHSFTLEAIAFLVTWYVLDALLSLLRNTLKKDR